MSIVGSLDKIALKAQTNMTGLKRAYSVGVSGVRPIPRTIDDGPVGTVWVGSGEMASGNAEHIIFTPTLDVWVPASHIGYANKTALAFIDLARTTFRTDMNLGGECTRCSMVGWAEPETQDVGSKPYLVLPIQLEVLLTRYNSDATS